MKKILNQLFDHHFLSRDTARDVLLRVAKGEFNHIQVAAFVAVYNMRPITIAELQGFRDALLELCVPFDADGQDTLDIVGTGGDSKNTFNISTLSAVVVAGAGYKVTKHGSYGVSSSVGSSDVLIALGYEFTNDRDRLLAQLEKANLCFLHAPLFHPALKEVVPVRKQLGMKTFFNMLGPLVNPVQPAYQLFGTFNLELSRLYQYIMQTTGRRFAIVFGIDGYDEISLTGPCKLRTNESERLMHPEDFGMTKLHAQDLHGGDTAEEAATIFTGVLHNTCTPAQFNVVTANAGTAIQCIKPEQSIEECIAEAKESIRSGRALETFKKLVN